MSVSIERPAAPPVGRAFRLSDLMILTVGVAVALAGNVHLLEFLGIALTKLARRLAAAGPDPGLMLATLRGSARWPLMDAISYGIQSSEGFVFAMTPAFLALRLIRPRPPIRELALRPGSVAALAIVFGFFWVSGWLILLAPKVFTSWNALPAAVGGSVILAWSALTVAGRWRPEPGWIDRLGRALGVVAVGMAVGAMALRVI